MDGRIINCMEEITYTMTGSKDIDYSIKIIGYNMLHLGLLLLVSILSLE